MRFSTFLYSVKQGMKNIGRNKMFSLASIATMAACIFLFGIFFSVVTNFKTMVKTAEEGVAVTVFFEKGIEQDKIDEIGKEIKKRPEVAKYDFVSADEAWKDFQKEYFKGNKEAAEGFEEDNPLANSSHYEIYLNDVSMQKALVTYLKGLDGVREVHQSEVAANTLSDLNSLIGYISAGIILILIAVPVFLISNTIRTCISVIREEIAIMKLIRATDLFVRAPFIVEGVMIGLIGSVLPLILLYFVYSSVITYVSEKFVFLSSMLNFLPVGQVFRVLVPVALLLGVGIGFLGSRVTTKRHLNV